MTYCTLYFEKTEPEPHRVPIASVLEQSLSDESKVYDLYIGEQVFHCTSEKAAMEFITKLADLVAAHTDQKFSLI